MDKSEFERLKAEEKAHLRQMRALKQKHRDAQRMASSAKALGAMRNQALEDETDAMTRKLMEGAAQAEARFEMASENAAQTGTDEVDRAALARAEAEALVRQMKAQMGGGADLPPTADAAAKAAPADGKTIGRTPPPADDDAPAASDDGAKTIGRRRA